MQPCAAAGTHTLLNIKDDERDSKEAPLIIMEDDMISYLQNSATTKEEYFDTPVWSQAPSLAPGSVMSRYFQKQNHVFTGYVTLKPAINCNNNSKILHT